MSNAERAFRAIYPNARVETGPSGIHGMLRFSVYAGDYLCAASLTRANAFKCALHGAEIGNITPDPEEVSQIGGAA